MTTVLLADDEPDTIHLARLHLVAAGFAVETAADGAEALRKARQHQPDLAIVDWLLPDTDGLELCRQLRELAPLPVILLIGRDDPADRAAALELGADDCLSKPFSLPELVARAKAALRRNPRAGWGGAEHGQAD